MANKEKKIDGMLEKERAQGGMLYVISLLLFLTGFDTYLFDSHGVVTQWIYVFHGLGGFFFIPVFLFFSFFHFKRTLGSRKISLIAFGLILGVAVVISGATGLDIAFRGQSETRRWVYDTHVYISIAATLVLLGHILGYRIIYGKKHPFPSVRSSLFRDSFVSVIALVSIIGCLSFITLANEPSFNFQPQVTPYEYPYGDHPFRPSQTETTSGSFVAPREIVGSERCGDCHGDIVREWKASIHKNAASDKAYVTNISLLAKEMGMASTRYCEGCHAPVALLTGQLTKGGRHGGIAGTAAFAEGISCLGCHDIEKAVHVKGVASYLYDPHKSYLFDGEENWLLRSIHNFVVRVNPKLHRRNMARSVLSQPKLCATCHAQFMDKDMNHWGWVKMQDEYMAWLNSPYSKQSEQSFSQKEVVRCQDCHMPLVSAEDPSANENGKIRSHRFVAANTAIPLLRDDTEQILLTKEFLQSNKMGVTIEVPRRSDATQTLKPIDERFRTKTETPFYYFLNEEIPLDILVANIGVGHAFPGGTLDINEAWVSVSVVDAQGKAVYRSGDIDAVGFVDPKANFYRSLPVDRKGRQVWKHDLFNRVGEIYHNSIPAGKVDVLKYRVPVPSWVKGPLTINATLKYRKLNQRYAKWALKDQYREIPVIDVARSTLEIPIREQKPVRSGEENL